MTKPNEERKAARALDAAAAMREYRTDQAHIASNMARLKALRVAQAEQHPLPPLKQPATVNNPMKGAVKKRSQLEIKVIGEKKSTRRKGLGGGQFVDQKKEGNFKGVRPEKVV